MPKHYNLYDSTIKHVLSEVFDISDDRFEIFKKGNEILHELNMDSLDVVEFVLEFDEATGGNLSRDSMDSITVDTTYQDLHTLAEKALHGLSKESMRGRVSLKLVTSEVSEVDTQSGVCVVSDTQTSTGVYVAESTPSIEHEPMPCIYVLGQRLQHKKSKDNYIIIELPYKHKRLEDSNEPYYRYRGDDDIEWSRKVSEMEDGRFVAI